MNWIKGEPNKEGFYLTLQNQLFGKGFHIPTILEYRYIRYRESNEFSLDENGCTQGVWCSNGRGVCSPDYYQELPKNPDVI